MLALLSERLGAETQPSKGFDHFYNNEYDQALAFFEAGARSKPDDIDIYNDIAQTILYREMYRDGSLESQLVTGSNAFLRRAKMEVSAADKAAFSNAIDRTLALGEKRLATNPKDVSALYATAVAHGLRANFLYLVEKSWIQSLREATASRKINDQILEISPNFADAHLIHGVSEYVVGCLPGYLRFVGAMKGFHGDKDDGVKELQKVFNSNARNRYDAAILLAVIYRRDHRPRDAVPLLKILADKFPRNCLFKFEQVQMYSDLGDKTAALAVLGSIEQSLRTGQPGYAHLPIERVRYARGNLLFWYGDLNQSLADLKEATAKAADLDLNTAVMAWLRSGQVYDLLGDRTKAQEAYRMTIQAAPRSDPAKEAEAYLGKPYRRKSKS